VNDVEGKYYADGEDAFDMRRRLNPKARPSSQQADQEKQQQQSQVWPALPNLLQTAHCALQHHMERLPYVHVVKKLTQPSSDDKSSV
jgi:hypothetical protein